MLKIHKYTGSEINKSFGTVLFYQQDKMGKCWKDEEIAMLASRKIFENLIPSNNVYLFDGDDDICAIIEYFQILMKNVRKYTSGRARHFTLMALTDTLGSYTKHTLLPSARFAYYCGVLKYDSVKKLYDSYEEFISFLHTDGKDWLNSPINWKKQFHLYNIEPYKFPRPKNNSCACDNLVYFDASNINKKCSTTTLVIPMPFFDTSSYGFDEKLFPQSIALPYRENSVRNMESQSSAYVLVKFYVSATRCIAIKSYNPGVSLKVFNEKFHEWLQNNVLPRINDDKFYVAFGGFFRLLSTIKKYDSFLESEAEQFKGLFSSIPLLNKVYNQMPNHTSDDSVDPKDTEEIMNLGKNSKTENYLPLILTALGVAFLVWLVFILIYYIARWRHQKNLIKNRSKKQPYDGGKTKSKRQKCLVKKIAQSVKKSTCCSNSNKQNIKSDENSSTKLSRREKQIWEKKWAISSSTESSQNEDKDCKCEMNQVEDKISNLESPINSSHEERREKSIQIANSSNSEEEDEN